MSRPGLRPGPGACAHALKPGALPSLLSPPSPLQMMKVEVTKFNKRLGIVKMDAKGYVGTELAVEAELTLAMGKAT